MLSLCFFPINNAWAFIFHSGDVAKGTPLKLVDEAMFFAVKADAIHAAEMRGLSPVKKGSLQFAAKADA